MMSNNNDWPRCNSYECITVYYKKERKKETDVVTDNYPSICAGCREISESGCARAGENKKNK
jgi:hypothetical protein